MQSFVIVLLLLVGVTAVKIDMLHKKRSVPTSFLSVDERNPVTESVSPSPGNMEPVTQTTTFADFAAKGVLNGDDPLSQLHVSFNKTDSRDSPFEANKPEKLVQAASLLEVSSRVTKVRSYCEICILVMQMKERGEPHLCAGLQQDYYITCVEVLESLLRADKALVYWLKNGCMHLDETGPEIVRPCPALSICSWVPNLFAQPPLVSKDLNEALCPKDPKFLPTIPEEYKSLLTPSGTTDSTTPPANVGLG